MPTANSVSLARLAGLIRSATRLLAFCHVNPDGDAVGSLLGLGHVLDALPDRRSVHLICQDPVPEELHFLPGIERIANKAPAGFDADLVVCVDASDPARLGKVFAELDVSSQTPVVVIDHHVTNLHFGAHNYVAPESASTSQLIVSLADELGLELTQALAFPLMVGLVTDTLGFRTSNVTSAELSCGVRLMDAGVDLADIAQRTLLCKPLNQMRLWGEAFVKAVLVDGVVWVEVTGEMRRRAGILDEDDGGLVSQLIMAAEARVAAVFNELKDGRIEVDLRARPPHNVATVALSLGGGGHPQASGCILAGPLSAARERVLPLLFGAAVRQPAS